MIFKRKIQSGWLKNLIQQFHSHFFFIFSSTILPESLALAPFLHYPQKSSEIKKKCTPIIADAKSVQNVTNIFCFAAHQFQQFHSFVFFIFSSYLAHSKHCFNLLASSLIPSHFSGLSPNPMFSISHSFQDAWLYVGFWSTSPSGGLFTEKI